MSTLKGLATAFLSAMLIIFGLIICVGVSGMQPSVDNTKATANVWQLQKAGILYAGNTDTYEDGLKKVKELHKKPGNYTVAEVIHLGDEYYSENHIRSY